MVKRNPRKASSRVEPELGDSRKKITWKKVGIVGLGIDFTNVDYCIWRPLEWNDVAIERKLSNKNTRLL